MKIKNIIPKSLKFCVQKMLYHVLRCSLENTAKEQGLKTLVDRLQIVVPDITEQYSTFKIDNPYLKIKARNLHAFQISLVDKIIDNFEVPVIVDIGDSSGTHMQYIIGLYSKNKDISCLSINLDEQAVEKIRRKGLKAIHAWAEDLGQYKVNADIFLCFEVLEHLTDPCRLLYHLSSQTNAKFLIITVPYLSKSRVGLHHIRTGRKDVVYAENTHIFELCPEDWKLIVKHSGWEVMEEKIYFQYPKKGLFCFTKPLWRRFDFEGFLGLILRKDRRWSSKYLDWKENNDAKNCYIDDFVRRIR